jgi:hypothetical protein
VDIKSQEEEELQRSFRSEYSIRGKDIFAAQKQHKKMLLERIHKFAHVVSTITKDKSSGKL